MADRLTGGGSPGDNVTDETRREAYREMLIAKRAKDEAAGIYLAVAKKFKALGVNPKAVGAAIKKRAEDPEVVKAELREEIRILELTNFPDIRTNLFGEPLSETEKSRHDMDLERATDAGHFAGAGSEKRDSNPHQPGSDFHVMWDEGFLEGEKALKARAAAMGERAGATSKASTTTAQPRTRGRPRRQRPAQVHPT